jgi:hypothetical protein
VAAIEVRSVETRRRRSEAGATGGLRGLSGFER